MATNDDFESKHPRTRGKFSDKEQGAPEIAGLAPAAPTKPRLPGSYGGYQLKSYTRHRAGMEGGGFTANLFKDGKKILAVSNDGNGGSNRYYPVGEGQPNWREDSQAFGDFSSRAIGDPEADGRYTEDNDSFIEFMANSLAVDKHAKKYQISRADSVEDHIRAWDEEAEKYGLPGMSEREKSILRDPSILD